ncbi:hypothetical protein FSOLCH5_010400 [Fusarium solani]
MAVRPRLIIPESPPILPHQYPPDHPISAASLRSERSVRSLQSNFSEASGTTVRSNPRPPEESTPYPDSANPLSGYPSNAFQSERRIYNGHMTVAGPDDGVTPSFNFDDISPVSPRGFWRADTPIRSPLSAGWTPGTAIGRKPEPFPWPEIIKSDTPPLATKTPKENDKKALIPNELKPATPLSPHSTASSNRTNRTVISESSDASKTTKRPSFKRDDSFARPSSPKSRNASASGMRERSDSALEVGDISAAISQHLEGISRRAESMDRLRSESANRSPAPERSQASRSRNCSRTRLGSATNNRQEHHMISIAASPSILWKDNQPPPRSSSRTGYHSRSQSFNNINAVLHAANGERARTPVASADPVPSARRKTSRGRAPEPKDAPTNAAMYGPVDPPAERASSSDSTRNQVLHSRTRRGRDSRTRKGSAGQHGRTSSRTALSPEVAAEFERVESVVCPSCPVHGRRSSSNANRHSDSGLAASNHQLSVRPAPTSPSGKSDSAAYVARADSSPQMNFAQRIENYYLIGPGAISTPDIEPVPQPPTKNESAEASDSGSLAGTLHTLSTPGRSPATPASYFNPSTPKAMVLKTDDLDVDYFPNGHLNGVVQADPVRVI